MIIDEKATPFSNNGEFAATKTTIERSDNMSGLSSPIKSGWRLSSGQPVRPKGLHLTRAHSRNVLERYSASARAAGLAARPAGNTAWSSTAAIDQSARTRTSAPLASSARQAQSAVDTIPRPATAAAVAPSLAEILCDLRDAPTPIVDHAETTKELVPAPVGPIITECPARSAGVPGTPARAR